MQLTPQVKSSLLTAIFTSALVLLAMLVYSHFYAPIDTSKQTPFTVQGTGTATAKPDQAQISFIVRKVATALQDAQNQANTATNATVDDIQKLGITKNDIQTNNYSSSPNYDNSGPIIVEPMLRPNTNNQNVVSYTVNEDVTVKVKDISKVNMVIDTITKDNAENISGPNYVFSDTLQKSLTNQARTQAINDAKQKAQSIANAADIHLGRILTVQDNNSSPIYPYPVMMGNKAAVAASGGSVPTNINPGENTVTDNVTLSYQTY